MQAPMLSAALQFNPQQACVTAMTTMDNCCSYRFAVTQPKRTAALVRATGNPQCPVLPCKTGLQQPGVTAITPTEICSSQKCAVSFAVYWGWVTAQLHEEHVSIGVMAMAKPCLVQSLQSSTELRRLLFAQGSAAVHFVGSLHSCMESISRKV